MALKENLWSIMVRKVKIKDIYRFLANRTAVRTSNSFVQFHHIISPRVSFTPYLMVNFRSGST